MNLIDKINSLKEYGEFFGIWSDSQTYIASRWNWEPIPSLVISFIYAIIHQYGPEIAIITICVIGLKLWYKLKYG